ncbi:hypothetical protein CCACVL1_14304, partial [Corchorus capsularis]
VPPKTGQQQGSRFTGNLEEA